VNYGSYNDSVTLMKDGNAHVYTLGTSVPAGSVMDLASARNITLLDIPDDGLERMRAINAGYQRMRIPAGTYPGQTRDVLTIGYATHLVARCDLDDELVADILDANRREPRRSRRRRARHPQGDAREHERRHRRADASGRRRLVRAEGCGHDDGSPVRHPSFMNLRSGTARSRREPWSRPTRSHEKRCGGLRQAVGMGVPTARSDNDEPPQRFSGLRNPVVDASEPWRSCAFMSGIA
jgi:hypothetical protein